VATLDVTGVVAGSVKLVAIADALESAPLTFEVTSGPPASIELAGSEGGPLESGATRTLTATLRDAANNLVTDPVEVSFDQSTGDGSVTGLIAVATSGGVASLEVTGDMAGSVTLVASTGALESARLTFDVTSGPPASIALTASEGGPLQALTTRMLTATVTDAAGNLVSDPVAVTFAQTGPGSVVVLGPSTELTSDGVASLEVRGLLPGQITI